MLKCIYGLYQSLLVINFLIIVFTKPITFLPNSNLFPVFGSLLILIAIIMDIYWEMFWNKNVIKSGSKKIITTGIYTYVRHPFLSVIILSSLGMAIVFNSLQCLIFSIILFIVVFIGSKKEEEDLIEKYGGEYKEYMNKVRYRFIPRTI